MPCSPRITGVMLSEIYTMECDFFQIYKSFSNNLTFPFCSRFFTNYKYGNCCIRGYSFFNNVICFQLRRQTNFPLNLRILVPMERKLRRHGKKLSAMSIHGENPFRSFFSRTRWHMALKFSVHAGE